MSNEILTEAVLSQLWAGLKTLKDCMDRCPTAEWNERHGDYPFSQIIFHTLFDCDYHLSDNGDEFRLQPFHRENPEVFGDYTGLEDFVPIRHYQRDFLSRYYQHCWDKTSAMIKPKVIEDLLIPQSDVRRNMTRLERYLNVIRHVQHHAAQLALTLQLLDGTETQWISWGVPRES